MPVPVGPDDASPSTRAFLAGGSAGSDGFGTASFFFGDATVPDPDRYWARNNLSISAVS